MRRGEIVQDVVDIILNNIRVPDERIGDIRAQIGALKTGEKRLTALLDRYGPETVVEGIGELKARSERQMRACIERVPDGVYRFTSYVDSDGVVNEPLAIALEMTVAGSNITFDFSRSSPPCSGPMNCVWATTQSAVYVAMKHIFPEVPINAGCFAPLRIPAPERTFLYAQYPRPVAGCAAEVAQRIMEAVFGAMGQAMPERMFASPAGTSGNLALGGWDPDRGSGYIMYFFSGGDTAAGGRPMDLPTVALRSAYLKPSRSRSWNSITRCYSRSTRYAKAQAEPAATVAALASTTASACSAAKERLPSSWTTGELGHQD